MACPGQPAEEGEYVVSTVAEVAHVRFRPGMYIGDTGARGLTYLLFSLVGESLAEVAAGRGNEVRVSLRADGSAEVSDDGRPMSNVEAVLTQFNAGERGDVSPYRSRTGIHDVTYVVVNALSERLTVVARTLGSTYTHAFRRGVTDSVLQSGGPPDGQGLTVTFRPDPDIFGPAQFDPAVVRERLHELAFLHSGVRFAFTDPSGTRTVFEYGDGIRELLEHLTAARPPLHDVLIVRGEDAGVRYEVGLRWCAEAGEVRSFANGGRTPGGGTHERGALAGAVAGLRDALPLAPADGFTAADLRAGLTAVVSVWLREPRLLGATRAELGNEEVEGVLQFATRAGVGAYFAAEPADAAKVLAAVRSASGAASARRCDATQ
jgi:DNA gyrase subunit B